MAYLDYSFYTANGGTVEESAFPRLEFMARRKLDHFTFQRVQSMAELPEAVRMLMVELVNLLATASPSALSAEARLSGFSNDGYSESYALPSLEESERALQVLIFDYLSGICDDSGVPLLYAGAEA